MKKTLKTSIYTSASLATVFAVVAVPTFVSAVTAPTTINATVGSTISMTSSTTVPLAITPVSGGSQSSASDTVTVNTNNSAGYTLTIANADADTSLTNGGNTITAHAGTLALPTALANNTWGFAVATVGGFDASYAALNNEASSTTKWAGVPASGAPVQLKTTAGVATNDVTTVWYSAKADTSKPSGVYSDTVTYTATAD